MTIQIRRIILFTCLVWGIALLFFPIRTDVITGRYTGNTPDTSVLTAVQESVTSSIAIRFNGHPGGIFALAFFAFMPFLVCWQSFGIERPFAIGKRTFLQLQALFLFLGAPYCYYISTFEFGYFYDTVHTTQMAFGGKILFAQNVLLSIFIFTAIGFSNGITGRFFELKKS
jgi:hypothetical protein